MDAASIVTGVLTILMPYVSKGAKELVSVVGDVGYQKARGLLAKLKAKWTGDDEATNTLRRFEDKPARYKPVLESILEEKLAQDQSLVRELSEALQDMGPTLKVIQEMDKAKGITGLEASEMSKGNASVTQKMKDAENVTGMKIDRIG